MTISKKHKGNSSKTNLILSRLFCLSFKQLKKFGAMKTQPISRTVFPGFEISPTRNKNNVRPSDSSRLMNTAWKMFKTTFQKCCITRSSKIKICYYVHWMYKNRRCILIKGNKTIIYTWDHWKRNILESVVFTVACLFCFIIALLRQTLSQIWKRFAGLIEFKPT